MTHGVEYKLTDVSFSYFNKCCINCELRWRLLECIIETADLLLFALYKVRYKRNVKLLVHGQVTIIFVVSVCLSVCLFVCLFISAEFFSAIFDPISINLGHMLYVWV